MSYTSTVNLGKNDPIIPASRSLKDPFSQFTGNIPVMFRVASGDGHAASGMEQPCIASKPTPAQREIGSTATSVTQSLCLTDLQAVAADIKATLSAAITDLRTDIHSIAARMGTIAMLMPSGKYKGPQTQTSHTF